MLYTVYIPERLEVDVLVIRYTCKSGSGSRLEYEYLDSEFLKHGKFIHLRWNCIIRCVSIRFTEIFLAKNVIFFESESESAEVAPCIFVVVEFDRHFAATDCCEKRKSLALSWKKLFQAADVNVPFRERSRPHYIFSAFKYDEQNRRWHPCVRLACPLGVLQSPLTSTINDLSPCPSPLIPVVGVRATVERTRVQRCSESHFCDTHVPG